MQLQTAPRFDVYPKALTTAHEFSVYPSATHGEARGPLIITPEAAIAYHRFDPVTLMLSGRRGRGKTAALTYLGRFFGDIYRRQGSDVRIASNYNTTVADPDLRRQDIMDDILSFPPWATKMLVLVDEIAAYYPSRKAMATRNVDASTFLQQIRKRDIEMIFTTQFPGMLDQQMLVNIDLYVVVNMWPREGWNAGKYCDLKIWDWHGQWAGEPVQPRIPPQGPPTWFRRMHNVNRIFGMYNTKEVIGRAWADFEERATIDAQHWGGEAAAAELAVMEAQAASLAASPEPTTLSEYVTGLGPSFNVAHEYTGARAFSDEIENVKDWERFLELMGFEILQERRSRMAVRR